MSDINQTSHIGAGFEKREKNAFSQESSPEPDNSTTDSKEKDYSSMSYQDYQSKYGDYTEEDEDVIDKKKAFKFFGFIIACASVALIPAILYLTGVINVLAFVLIALPFLAVLLIIYYKRKSKY